MSSQNEIDNLRFPNGLSVRQAKSDAKALKKQKRIKLHEALQIVAAQNGIALPWEQVIEKLKSSTHDQIPNALHATLSLNTANNTNDNSIDGGKYPAVILTTRNVTEIEVQWFLSLPYVQEFTREVIERGRKYGVVYRSNHYYDGDPDISLNFDLQWCSAEQEVRALEIPYHQQAFKTVADIASTGRLRFSLSALITDRSNRKLHQHIQSIYDLVKPGTKYSNPIEKLADLSRSEVYTIAEPYPHHRFPSRPKYEFTRAKRVKSGYELYFLMDVVNEVHLAFPLEAYDVFVEFGKCLRLTPKPYFLQLFHERLFRSLIKWGQMEINNDGGIATPYRISGFGVEIIKGFMEIDHELRMGRIV